MTLEVGLLFIPAKVVLPSQRVKYCGFIYDTADIPALKFPTDNRDHALAMLDYLFTKCDINLSHLVISVV